MIISLPDRESLELLHEVALDLSGGKPGVHDEKMLLSAIERPLTYIQYIDKYDLDTVCALLIDSVARYHGFRDGNKRTALMTAIFTYRVNGVHFKATAQMNMDFDELVMWVVKKKPSIDKITERLCELRVLHEGNEETWSALFEAFVKSKIGHRHKG
jgi:death-on-curing family protein